MNSSPFNSAIKEWAIAIDTLINGRMILLMRKGGIREERGQFQVRHRRVWLYPTYEHQQPQWLKPPYQQRVEPVESGWHPETVSIQAWADITHILSLSDASSLDNLAPFHVWTESFATERFKWKPRSPLYLLLLRVYRLPQPQPIAYSNAYGGCRSWISLEPTLDPSAGIPVLDDADYQQRVSQIKEATHEAIA